MVNAVQQAWRLRHNPIQELAEPACLLSALCWMILFVLIGAELAGYFRWHAGAVKAAELIPVCELDAGAVLTGFEYRGRTYYIISKSGGFGKPDLFCRLADSIGAGNQEEN